MICKILLLLILDQNGETLKPDLREAYLTYPDQTAEANEFCFQQHGTCAIGLGMDKDKRLLLIMCQTQGSLI
jgi:hypothetical protein